MDAKRAPVNPQLPPGFRFCPTDGELVLHYLRRRALAVPLPAEVDIPDVRLLAHDPSDLLPPGWGEPERYFFTCKEAKYVKGRRANRATDAGYWKATGKEKPVGVAFGAGGRAVLVGMKRSLVFYRGRPPTGTKTAWVMHEFRLAGAGLMPCRRGAPVGGVQQMLAPAEGVVLCRVFRKKGAAVPAAAGAAAAQEEEDDAEEEAVVDAEQEEEKEDKDEDAAPAPAAAAAPAPSGFIDFFARADAAQPQPQQRRAGSPVVSSSCLTDA